MGTASGFGSNLGHAVGTLLRRRFLGGLLLSPHPVNAMDEQKDRSGRNEKTDNGIDEQAIVNGHRTRRLRGF